MNEKIQIIQHKEVEQDFTHECIAISNLSNPISLDNFDINVINLSSESIWMTGNRDRNETIYTRDFENIKGMIFDSKASKIIILYPQNISFSSHVEVIKPRKLQYLTDNVKKIVGVVYTHAPPIGFEKNFKRIKDKQFSADFYFKFFGDALISSDSSNKALAIIQDDRIISTTLRISNTEDLFDFLNEIYLINVKTQMPDWFGEIECYDDKRQITIIDRETEKIKNSEIKINESKEILEKNNRYKSILYTNSDELVCVVFEILEEMFGCNLSEFNDVKKEDFLIRFEDNLVLIGEIKGVTSNVRFEHISQVEQHYRRYLDDNPGHVNETIKQVLIINYERKKKPSERTEIHDDQIKLAKRNGCLIIDTVTLLKIHELYLNENIGVNQLKEYVFNNSGLFDISEIT